MLAQLLAEFFKLAAVWLDCRQRFDDEKPVFNMIGQMDQDAEMYRIIKEMSEQLCPRNR